MTLTTLLLLASVVSPSAAAVTPDALWVAPLEGHTIQEAVETGAAIRDRFPEAVLLDDAVSVEILRNAGFRPSTPLPARSDAEVFLVRHHAEIDPDRDPSRLDWSSSDVDVLWSDGPSALVQTRFGLPDTGIFRHAHKQRLSPIHLTWPEDVELPLLRATSFDAEIANIVSAVDSAAYYPWIEDLAGANSVTVGGQSMTFSTRNTRNVQCDNAEQYVYEAFQAMGFTKVEYDTFNVQSTQARNVIATLPGTETPDDVYILCGHLDSTSPVPNSTAPGANDNASGTAAVLLGAEILKNYQFRSTIKFIAFTGEEQGLYGSQHYATEAAAAGDNILGVINCDMISWWGSRYRVDIEGELFADAFMQVMKDACTTYTGLGTAKVYGAWGSDHVPFLNQGIPTFLAIESDYGSYPCYHQTCDTAAQNKVGFGVEVTQACLATIAHSAEIISTTDVEPIAGAASRLNLSVSPNPFGDAATLRFQLGRAEHVRIDVHDVTGRVQRHLTDTRLGAGSHAVKWGGTGQGGARLPAGVYYLRLETESGLKSTRPVTLVR